MEGEMGGEKEEVKEDVKENMIGNQDRECDSDYNSVNSVQLFR